jgi:hypothetical protein
VFWVSPPNGSVRLPVARGTFTDPGLHEGIVTRAGASKGCPLRRDGDRGGTVADTELLEDVEEADGFPVPGLMRRNNDDAAEEGGEAISPAMQSANRNFGAADDKPASGAVRSLNREMP